MYKAGGGSTRHRLRLQTIARPLAAARGQAARGSSLPPVAQRAVWNKQCASSLDGQQMIEEWLWAARGRRLTLTDWMGPKCANSWKSVSSVTVGHRLLMYRLVVSGSWAGAEAPPTRGRLGTPAAQSGAGGGGARALLHAAAVGEYGAGSAQRGAGRRRRVHDEPGCRKT